MSSEAQNTTPSRIEQTHTYDDMDSVFNNVLIDDVMDISGLTDTMLPERQAESRPLPLESVMNDNQLHSTAGPLEEHSMYSNVSLSDFSLTDMDGGGIQDSNHSGKHVPSATNDYATITRSPVLSQEFDHLELIEDDDDVVMIKEENIKQEGTVQTSVSQLIRIYNSKIKKESEWRQIKRVIVQVRFMKNGAFSRDISVFNIFHTVKAYEIRPAESE